MFLLVWTLTSPCVPYLLVFFDENEAREAIRDDDLTGTLLTVRCKSPPETGSELQYSKELLRELKKGKTLMAENFY